jgi:hypothetical protein
MYCFLVYKREDEEGETKFGFYDSIASAPPEPARAVAAPAALRSFDTRRT